ncbi:MAG: helix-turn-helix transcriptional regulator [Pseudanabaena sp. CRU_2_10]|nr:helix-turn-helix transcriptional regulator [Pseudanabaena sp. CRU_2_10]
MFTSYARYIPSHTNGVSSRWRIDRFSKVRADLFEPKARDICQQFWNGSYPSTQLPPILSHISYQLLRNISTQTKPLIIDYQVGIGLTIRIRAFQFPNPQGQELSTPGSERHYILVFLEDRNVTLNEELKIEQRKYDLTERETQILHLLSQTYSYQEIASKLQISLNTVKFHVKNINSQKRSQSESERQFFDLNQFLNQLKTTQKCGFIQLTID